MRTYETTFIINPQSDDATIDKHVKDIADIIKSSNGEIIHQENMGTRRLAYEIKGLTQGFYANFLYNADADVLPKLDKHFKQTEAYLRNLTIRVEGDVEEILKPIDVLGKQVDRGADRDDRSDDRGRASRGEKKAEEKTEAAPAEKAEAEEAKAEEAPEETAEETKTEEPAAEETDENPKEEL